MECESVLGVRNVVIGGLLVFAQVVDQDRAGGARRRDDIVVLRKKSDFGSLGIVNDALVGYKATVYSFYGILASS